MKRLCLLALCAMSFGLLAHAPRALAVEAFKKEFLALYVKADSTEAGDQEFAAAVKKANCNVCHVGTKKKDRNEYGKALDELLDKKADIKNTEKIRQALETVAAKKSNPADESSPTFGDLIKAHKLPGGDAAAAPAAGGN